MTLTPLTGLRASTLALLLTVPGIAQDMLGVAWTGGVFSISSATGMAQQIGSSGFQSVNSSTIDGAGRFLAGADTGTTLIEIDPVTGAGTALGLLGIGNVRSMAFRPTNGLVYAVTVAPNELWTFDPVTLASSLVGPLTLSGIQGLAFATDGRLYGWSVNSGLLRIDPQTAAITNVNPAVGGSTDVQFLDFAPSGQLFGGQDELYTIDTTTGMLTLVGPMGFIDLRGADFTSSSGGPIGASYCSPANANSTGSPGQISASGSVQVADNNVVLSATSLPAGQFGYFLAGETQGSFQPPGSSGILCLSGNIGRYNAAPLIIQGPSGSIAIDLNAIPVNPTQPASAGETWNFQCWYRDGGAVSNFTDAVSITFQ